MKNGIKNVYSIYPTLINIATKKSHKLNIYKISNLNTHHIKYNLKILTCSTS